MTRKSADRWCQEPAIAKTKESLSQRLWDCYWEASHISQFQWFWGRSIPRQHHRSNQQSGRWRRTQENGSGLDIAVPRNADSAQKKEQWVGAEKPRSRSTDTSSTLETPEYDACFIIRKFRQHKSRCHQYIDKFRWNERIVNANYVFVCCNADSIYISTKQASSNQFEHQYYSRKPLVSLPKFEGNPCEWPMFLAEYRRTTAEYNYSSTENTSRLNDCLKANDLVQWLLIHNNMSEKVIERLQARFGKTDLLVEAQLALLREIPKIHDSKLEQIVPFADKVVNFAHFMMSSNCEHQLSNPTLLNGLVIKLPMSIRISWSTHSITLPGHPIILEFSEWIEKLADSIYRVPTRNAISIQPSERKPPTKKASVMYASEASSEPKPELCAHCSLTQWSTS